MRPVRFGFMWNCPWRVQWAEEFEYWYRGQFGPVFWLRYKIGVDERGWKAVRKT